MGNIFSIAQVDETFQESALAPNEETSEEISDETTPSPAKEGPVESCLIEEPVAPVDNSVFQQTYEKEPEAVQKVHTASTGKSAETHTKVCYYYHHDIPC